MTSCDLPEGIVEIPHAAFIRCTGLTDVKIPTTMRDIASCAFMGCQSLSSVILPNGLQKIGFGAFGGCANLADVVLPESLETIGDQAFGASNLRSLTLPSKVREIGLGLVGYCTELESLTVDENNPYFRSEGNGIIDRATNMLVQACSHTVIPTDIDGIADYGFVFVEGVEEIVIPDNVKSIGYCSFQSCKDLKRVILPANIEQIGEEAFLDCPLLESITVLNPAPLSIADNVFYEDIAYAESGNTAFTTATLYVPYGCKAAYQAAAGWKNFQNIVEMEPENKQGDLNGDDLINGTDLVALVSVIMGQEEQSQAADVNADGLVNGTDYVALVDLILNEGNAPVKALVRDNVHHQSEVALGIEPFGMESAKEGMMTITLDNPEMDVTMVQFDLTLPRGLRLQSQNDDYSVLMTGRTTWKDHAIFVGKQDDGSVRLMLASAQNATVKDTEGGILRISLVADDDFDGGEVVINNILCTSPSLLECRPQACRIHLTKEDVTAIREASADASEGNLYNLAGQSVSKPQKGLYISNGRKRIVR